MTPMTLLILLASLGVALVIWTWSLRLWYAYRTSVFRYALWRLRDSIEDDVLAGALPGKMATARLLNSVENMILRAKEMRMLLGIFLPKPPAELRAVLRDRQAVERTELSEAALSRLKDHEATLHDIVCRHLLTGSVTGLALRPFFFRSRSLTRNDAVGRSESSTVTEKIAVAVPAADRNRAKVALQACVG